MRKILTILTIGFILISCEKTNENPEPLQTDFKTRILDGYFIKSIAFDNIGNAWIGTFKQGLIKYNSSETVIYNSENSIISDTSVIYDIAIDSKNNVWISCDGLIKYDGTSFVKYSTDNSPIPEDFISSIAIDSKDNIWFSSSRFRQGGIVKYDNTNWTVYTPDNSDLPVSFVQSIAIDESDNVWLALNEIVNDSYLVKISNNNWTTYTSSDLGFTPYYFGNIEINSKNELCGSIDYSLSSMITNSGPQVFVYSGNSSAQLQFDNESNIKFISIDNQDNIWCGTYGGYAVYNGQEWTIDNSSFKDLSVFTIEQSPDNKMWIGTGSGIYINDRF
jgi:ligand-binding sensor domain-containing protein